MLQLLSEDFRNGINQLKTGIVAIGTVHTLKQTKLFKSEDIF